MNITKPLLAVVLMSCGAFTAQASTVVNIDVAGKSGTTTVNCDLGVDCDGLLSEGTIDESNAFGFPGAPSSEASIAAQFFAATGISVGASDVTKFNTPDGTGDFTFNVSGGWFFVKAGSYRSYIFADKATSVFFDKDGNDPGLSNYGWIDTGFATVPLPAAGWLLLAGLGGLAAMRRRTS